MFLDFAGMMININYIINIYKNDCYSMSKNKPCIDIKYNNIQNYQIIREFYDTEKERNKRFNKIINKLKI